MNEEVLWRRYRNKRRVILGISIAIVVALYAIKNYSSLAGSLSAIGLLVVFYMLDHLFSLDFKNRHYILITFIAIFGFLLSPLYYLYPGYDKVLHFVQPVMLGAIVFHMVSRLKLELKWKLTFVFFIVVASVGLFEIGEYGLDMFFDLRLQGVFLKSLQGLEKFDVLLDRIDDTMIDMILGVVGAIVYVGFVKIFKKK